MTDPRSPRPAKIGNVLRPISGLDRDKYVAKTPPVGVAVQIAAAPDFVDPEETNPNATILQQIADRTKRQTLGIDSAAKDSADTVKRLEVLELTSGRLEKTSGRHGSALARVMWDQKRLLGLAVKADERAERREVRETETKQLAIRTSAKRIIAWAALVTALTGLVVGVIALLVHGGGKP